MFGGETPWSMWTFGADNVGGVSREFGIYKQFLPYSNSAHCTHSRGKLMLKVADRQESV